ncbi:M16 family metallopeptidase [Chitinivibrio alkaliphilus]|uniref:Peptidase, M16 family n=1 Tax=Chitinivibrio alkaliphilus ACht1 TaxID=1313304 RepID=U7D8T1_9BACT|nr:pitrilysin family protein [Chitinivibrio alkaliphilus]ERP39345.1 peptidase, M16 family [Chitinivibrio alkaliphilus ACht1]
MQKKRVIITILVLVFSLSAVSLDIIEHRLDNGLKILLVPDTTVSVASCRLYYFSGSYYETSGTTGLSHMYEHMMFKGTTRLGTRNFEAEIPIMEEKDRYIDSIISLKNRGYTPDDSIIIAYDRKIRTLLDQQREYIIKDEIWELYNNAGATGLNAWTSSDITAYIVTLPAHKTELFFNIEADRMENLVLREFYSERDVVTEERRQVYENNGKNHYLLKLNALFYTASPYRYPTIGWYSDIRSYTREKLRKHIGRFYRPDNAMIVIAGNIDPEQTYDTIKRYFGDIKTPDTPLPMVVTREPAPLGVRRFEVLDDSETPRVDILFHTPGHGDSSRYALDLLQNMLSGTSGRLHRRLITEENLAVSVGASNRWAIADGRFHIWAELLPDACHRSVEEIILEEIDALAQHEPSSFELEKTQNQLEFFFIKELRNLERLSDNLAYFQKFGDWRELLNYTENISAVTSTKSAAQKHLNKDFRTVGYLINKKGDTE